MLSYIKVVKYVPNYLQQLKNLLSQVPSCYVQNSHGSLAIASPFVFSHFRSAVPINHAQSLQSYVFWSCDLLSLCSRRSFGNINRCLSYQTFVSACYWCQKRIRSLLLSLGCLHQYRWSNLSNHSPETKRKMDIRRTEKVQ